MNVAKHLLIVFPVLCAAHCQSLSLNASNPDYDLLAEEAINHSPGNHSFPASVRWCLYYPPKNSPLPEYHAALLTKLKNKYNAVYNKASEVPEEFTTVQDGNVVGYRGGASFNASPEVIDARTVRIFYSNWYGNVGASSYSITYKWTGSQWEVIEKSEIIMS